MKIGLLGFTFSNANMGCEALTYSFLYTIQRLFGDDVEICYFSYSSDFGYVQDYFPKFKFSYQPLTRKDIFLTLKKCANTCDVVYDISYGDGFSDIYNPKGVFRNTLIKQIINYSRSSLVLLPQTYGPFNNKLLEFQAANAIRRAKTVFSRDILSSEYVQKITGRKVITVTDLAFSLPYEKKEFADHKKIRLGINVSGLLWKGGFYKENQFGLTVNYQKYIKSLIEYYYSKENIEIHLIPHVIETIEGSNDGDLFVNKLLSDEFPNLICAPTFKSPIDTKNYIAGMDVMTAARMHATVDAFSSEVPVIPFAYSRKFEGLYNSIGYHYIIDGCKLKTDEAINKTIELIDKRFVLKQETMKCLELVGELTDEFNNILLQSLLSNAN